MRKTSYFHDPIYGHIYLSHLERAVVDTLEFQRLRFIRQNSLLHYVFPGAFHTRFSHSLGTCHNAYRLLKQLIFWRRDQYSHYSLQVARLACLLHDVGHGAFSHTLPNVRINDRSFLPSLKEALEDPLQWEFTHSKDDPIEAGIKSYFKGHENNPIEHEALSVLIIKRIFQILSNGTEKHSGQDLLMGVSPSIWAQDVASLIINSIPASSHFLNESKNLIQDHISQIPQMDQEKLDLKNLGQDFKLVLASLVSGTIDADRMDYLLRDSTTCGINYGLYDDVGLIEALNLVIEKGHLKLGLNSKRTNTLDDYLWSRYQMFKQVYCHKTHNAYNVLLELAMNDLAKGGIISAPQTLDDYLKLTDDHIMSRVFEYAQSHPTKHTWVQAFAKRKLPKLLGIFEASMNDPIWKKDPKEIFKTMDFEKYPGWHEDPFFITTSQKTEVVRSLLYDQTLPIIFNYDKNKKYYVTDSYLEKSVFFNPELDPNLRLKELCERLNRRLLYFYKIQ